MLLVASVENAGQAGRVPHLNGLHFRVAEGLSWGPAPVPESMVLGVHLAF